MFIPLIPYEILKYIFSFQKKWWLIKNKLINIEKLHLIKRVNIRSYPVGNNLTFIYSIRLPITPLKYYYLFVYSSHGHTYPDDITYFNHNWQVVNKIGIDKISLIN
jgi:hypothetical protein